MGVISWRATLRRGRSIKHLELVNYILIYSGRNQPSPSGLWLTGTLRPSNL